MLKNKNLAETISNATFYELKRQLLYKAKLRGCIIVEVPMFYPSSKLCSCCGWKNIELKLSDRSWTCQECDTLHDRDVNAAINLRNYAASYAVKASGEISSGLLAA